jgi:hypothetical protein
MTALAKNRFGAGPEKWTYKVFTLLSGQNVFQGASLCVQHSSGKLVESAGGPGLFFVGLAAEAVDASAADKQINVNLCDEVTVFRFVNATAGNAIAATDIGRPCYFLDDQTVSINAVGPLAGRIWDVSTTKGIAVEKMAGSVVNGVGALPAYVANDSIPTFLENGVVYDVPTTGAASTVTLPAAAIDGTVCYFAADGTKNGHTVQYRDATGPVNLTAALTASKRHLVTATKLGGKWFCAAQVSP